MSTLRLERDGQVAWLWLNRPERLNAFVPQMWDELREVGAQLCADGEVRAVVVIGEGRAFSSGLDLSVFEGGNPLGDKVADDAPPRHADPLVDRLLRVQDAFNWLEDAPFPTIAAVRGYALGAGLQLALACDIRVFAEGSSVGLLELRYGIMPDLGGTQRLPRLVGAGKAKELVLTGARIDASEAHRIGLCERLVPDDSLVAAAAALAADLAAQPPLAVRGAKRAIAVAGAGSRHDGLVLEAEGQAACLRSDDMREALAALAEQRPPHYQGH